MKHIFLNFLIFLLLTSCSIFSTEPHGRIVSTISERKAIISFSGQNLQQGEKVYLFRSSRERNHIYKRLISEATVTNLLNNGKYEIEFADKIFSSKSDILRLKNYEQSYEIYSGGKL